MGGIAQLVREEGWFDTKTMVTKDASIIAAAAKRAQAVWAEEARLRAEEEAARLAEEEAAAAEAAGETYTPAAPAARAAPKAAGPMQHVIEAIQRSPIGLAVTASHPGLSAISGLVSLPPVFMHQQVGTALAFACFRCLGLVQLLGNRAGERGDDDAVGVKGADPELIAVNLQPGRRDRPVGRPGIGKGQEGSRRHVSPIGDARIEMLQVNGRDMELLREHFLQTLAGHGRQDGRFKVIGRGRAHPGQLLLRQGVGEGGRLERGQQALARLADGQVVAAGIILEGLHRF